MFVQMPIIYPRQIDNIITHTLQVFMQTGTNQKQEKTMRARYTKDMKQILTLDTNNIPTKHLVPSRRKE